MHFSSIWVPHKTKDIKFTSTEEPLSCCYSGHLHKLVLYEVQRSLWLLYRT